VSLSYMVYLDKRALRSRFNHLLSWGNIPLWFIHLVMISSSPISVMADASLTMDVKQEKKTHSVCFVLVVSVSPLSLSDVSL